MFQILQTQVSLIIIHNLGEIGITKQKLIDCKLESGKVNFLYGLLENENHDKSQKLMGYGFNFSDLARIIDAFDLKIEYLLSGKNKT